MVASGRARWVESHGSKAWQQEKERQPPQDSNGDEDFLLQRAAEQGRVEQMHQMQRGRGQHQPAGWHEDENGEEPSQEL